MTTTPTHPGYARQSTIRTAFRVATFVVLAAALVTGGIGLRSLFTTDGFEEPEHAWLLFVAVPLLAVAGWCSMAGFGGAAARYSAGESMPVVRDSASYLTDGRGVLGIGRTAGRDRFCTECGSGNTATARFCDACGAAITPRG